MPVMMVVSEDKNGEERCSPFSWGTPVSKDGMFVLAMRKSSKTLQNIEEGRTLVTVSWVPATEAVAQKVLLTKSPNPEPFHIVKEKGWNRSVPALSVASILASAVQLNGIPSSSTHRLVFFLPLDTRMTDAGRLLHSNGKIFGRMLELHPKGY